MAKDPKLPLDVWIGLHGDTSICLDWVYMSFKGGGVMPVIRVRENAPPLRAQCEEDGEQLTWTRSTMIPVNAAARYGGSARMIDEE